MDIHLLNKKKSTVEEAHLACFIQLVVNFEFMIMLLMGTSFVVVVRFRDHFSFSQSSCFSCMIQFMAKF